MKAELQIIKQNQQDLNEIQEEKLRKLVKRQERRLYGDDYSSDDYDYDDDDFNGNSDSNDDSNLDESQ